MSKQVQWFITTLNRMIEEDGLLQLSAVKFVDSNGNRTNKTAMDVLKSKQYECQIEQDIGMREKEVVSLPQIAETLNLFLDFEAKSVQYRKRKYLKRKSYECKPYVDPVGSQRKDYSELLEG